MGNPALALALFSLVAWGTSGNYASSEAVSDIRVEVKGHDVQIQAHERIFETMARQIDDIHKVLIDDRAIGNINRR